jgi:cysteine desulfurase
LQVDFLTASAHKFNGAKGTGFVYVKSGLTLPHLIFDGGQEHGYRAGTENVAGIVALGIALDESVAMIDAEAERKNVLVHKTVAGIKEVIPDVHTNGENADRLPGTLNITLPGVSGESMMHLLDLKDVCISTSSACTSGKNEPSHVLVAIGLSESQAKSSIRISYGRYNTDEDVNTIIRAICTAYNKIAAGRGTRQGGIN